MQHTSVARAGRALLGIALGVACLGGTAAVAAADDQDAAEPDRVHGPEQGRDRQSAATSASTSPSTSVPSTDGIVINAMVDREQELAAARDGLQGGQRRRVAASTTPRHAPRRTPTQAAGADSFANLKAGHAVKRAAAADTVLTSRADYFENYAGRYISIEARAERRHQQRPPRTRS